MFVILSKYAGTCQKGNQFTLMYFRSEMQQERQKIYQLVRDIIALIRSLPLTRMLSWLHDGVLIVPLLLLKRSLKELQQHMYSRDRRDIMLKGRFSEGFVTLTTARLPRSIFADRETLQYLILIIIMETVSNKFSTREMMY